MRRQRISAKFSESARYMSVSTVASQQVKVSVNIQKHVDVSWHEEERWAAATNKLYFANYNTAVLWRLNNVSVSSGTTTSTMIPVGTAAYSPPRVSLLDHPQ